jgi:hypothetical protein
VPGGQRWPPAAAGARAGPWAASMTTWLSQYRYEPLSEEGNWWSYSALPVNKGAVLQAAANMALTRNVTVSTTQFGTHSA